jgi:hypothetical protein
MKKTVEFPTMEILKPAKNQEKENLFGNLEQNMRETLKMAFAMGLEFSPIQKKITKTTMKVIGRMARNQEKENLSGKMEQNMKATLKMTFTMDLVFTASQ